VSKLVNNTYNIGFPELLNALRIDYAEQYILNHRDAKQAEIAEACGFLSASSFNNIFKKVKGIPPRMWIESLTDKNHKTD
jgi:YesN/AraC family two-component response regulator